MPSAAAAAPPRARGRRSTWAGARRTVRVVTLATLGLVGGRATVAAHPQASPDRNNRYVKLTPMADRIRLAYTVYLGDQPGAHARRRLDRDRDGTIDDREAAVIGDELAGQIRPAVELTVDDRVVAIDWATIDVGLGTPATAAGALSVDLIGWACTGDGGAHHVVLRDQVRLDSPGEVEVRVEEGPGVTIGRRRLGGDAMADLVATWRGDDRRLATGLELAYDLDGARAIRPDDRRCASGGRRGGGGARRSRAIAAAVAAGAILGAVAAVLVGRRRRRRAQGPRR